MSKKCRAYSKSKLGLEPTDNRKAFYAGWDAALAQQAEPVQEPVDAHTTTLRNLLECCLTWKLDARVLGNVTARQAITALRAALAQQEEPQTLDEAMSLPRAMAQAYENGYKAGVAAERKRIIQFLTEMQRQVGDGHNYYGVAAMRIRERA